jgi:CheY-specific phosphatase CheX
MKASDLASLMPECCAEVLDAMYFSTVLSATRSNVPITIVPTDFAFSLSFHGDVQGRFGLHLNSEVALTLAANFLGEEESTLVATEVAEVIGELSNMLCGSVMSRVGGARNFVLSHPEPVTSPPVPDVSDALVIDLETDGGIITTWVVVEGNE